MPERDVKQFEVETNEPSMVAGSNDKTKYIVRVGLLPLVGDYDAAFATIYAQLEPEYGASSPAASESRFGPVYALEVRLTGLDRSIAEGKGVFSEQKMKELLLSRAESATREMIRNKQYGSPLALGYEGYIWLSVSDFA